MLNMNSLTNQFIDKIIFHCRKCEMKLSKLHHIYFSSIDIVILVIRRVSSSILVVMEMTFVLYEKMLPLHHQSGRNVGDNFQFAKINLLCLIIYQQNIPKTMCQKRRQKQLNK